MRLAQKSDHLVGPQMLEHLPGVDEVDASVLHRRQVAERALNPLDVRGQSVGGARVGVDADMPLHLARVVLGEPLEVPASSGTAVQDRARSGWEAGELR